MRGNGRILSGEKRKKTLDFYIVFSTENQLRKNGWDLTKSWGFSTSQNPLRSSWQREGHGSPDMAELDRLGQGIWGE